MALKSWLSLHQKRKIRIHLSASYTVTAIQSLQFSLIIFSFMYRSSISLSTSSFHVFLGLLLCLSSSKVHTFSPTHHHPFLKHVHRDLFLWSTSTMSSIPCLPRLSDVLVKRYVDFCILPSQYCSFSFAITVAKCQCDTLNGFSRES